MSLIPQTHNPPKGGLCFYDRELDYFICAETSFVISNIVTSLLPPKTAFSLSSARIFRLFFGFWRSCFLMYSQIFLTTWERGIGPAPTTASRSASRLRGFDKAGLSAR